MSAHKLIKIRCPQCKGENCGHDAYAQWNPITQNDELGGVYDNEWCSDCGDISLEVYEPKGEELKALRAEIAAHKAREALNAAAPALLEALRNAETVIADLLNFWPVRELHITPKKMKKMMRAAIAKAQP